MVNLVQQNNIKFYQCSECGLHYADKAKAEKCEAWCKEQKSCNLEIIKESVEDQERVKQSS